MSAPFGQTSGDAPARLYTLANRRGLVVRLTDHGAAIVEVHTPDRHGSVDDIVLGFDSVTGYSREPRVYFGATVGRVANRIADGSFTIDGRRYELARNEPPHHLHGGVVGSFDRVVWQVARADDDTVEFAHVSPAGNEGYPGQVQVHVTYRLLDAALAVEYRAVTDETTPVNITNHSYWNLHGAGNGTVLDHELQVFADAYTPTGEDLIPTGVISDVTGTPHDFRTPVALGSRIGELVPTGAEGYDHNYVLRQPGRVRTVARLSDPVSGRVLEVVTDQPGLQVYSGNRIHSPISGKAGKRYVRYGGVCLEPQHHPDALHHPHFPTILLEPTGEYRHTSMFRFATI